MKRKVREAERGLGKATAFFKCKHAEDRRIAKREREIRRQLSKLSKRLASGEVFQFVLT